MKRTAVWKIAIFILAAALIGLTAAILDTHGTSDEIRGLRVSTKGGEAGDLAQWSRYRKVFEGLNLAWARLPLAWSKIETSPGTYDWSSQEYNLAKNAIQSARGMGAEVVLTIKNVPDQTAALSSTQTPAPEFYDCQAQYASSLLDWTQQKAAQGKLLGFIWYTIGSNGWAETDLLFPNKTPKPVYSVWKR